MNWVDRKISVTYSDVDALIHVSNQIFRGVVKVNHNCEHLKRDIIGVKGINKRNPKLDSFYLIEGMHKYVPNLDNLSNLYEQRKSAYSKMDLARAERKRLKAQINEETKKRYIFNILNQNKSRMDSIQSRINQLSSEINSLNDSFNSFCSGHNVDPKAAKHLASVHSPRQLLDLKI